MFKTSNSLRVVLRIKEVVTNSVLKNENYTFVNYERFFYFEILADYCYVLQDTCKIMVVNMDSNRYLSSKYKHSIYYNALLYPDNNFSNVC